MKKEFYVLLSCSGQSVEEINWKCHGKSGVYTRRKPQKGDKIILVREVKPRKKK